MSTLARSMETETAVRRFSEMLASELDLDELTQRALDLLMEHAGADGGAILLEVEGELRLANSRGLDAPQSLVESDHVRRISRG